MKSKVIFFGILIISNIVFAQVFNTDFSRYEFKADKKGSEILASMTLEVDQLADGFTKVILNKDNKEEEYFLIKPLDFVKFNTKFVNLMKKLEVDLKTENKKQILELYSDITSYFFSINERPQIATIYLKDNNVDIYATLLNKNKDKEKGVFVGKLSKVKVDISFYSGFIEKIEVSGTIDDIDVKFSNKFSIGVSSLKNIKNFQNIGLESNYKYLIDYRVDKDVKLDLPEYNLDRVNRVSKIKNNTFSVKKVKVASRTEFQELKYLYIYLNDVIRYDRLIDVNANDISPDKQKIHLEQDEKSAKLYKEESTKILEAVVFTDLIGTLDEDNPNGIIQTEISKRFNINTSRYGVTKCKRWLSFIMPPFLVAEGWGSFEYLDVKILLSKIEDDNKFLIPISENEDLKLIGLYQHRNFSIGGNLNLLAFENQNLKFNMFFDTGFEFSKSAFKLSEDSPEAENLNFMEYNVSLKSHLFPEKRYGIYVTDKLSYFETLNDEEATFSIDETSYWLNTIEFMAYLDVSTSSKIFARYRLIHELADIDNNFSQLQLGVNFYILEKNRKD